MAENGTVIFIDVPVDALIERLHNSQLSNRPKLNYDSLETTINEIYNSRIKIYQQANIALSGSDIKVSQILKAISN
jgi:shikimate kinase